MSGTQNFTDLRIDQRPNAKKDANGVLSAFLRLEAAGVLAAACAEPDSLEALVELRNLSAAIDKAL